MFLTAALLASLPALAAPQEGYVPIDEPPPCAPPRAVNPAYRELLRTHYANALEELRAVPGPVSAEREHSLAALEAYRLRGDFGFHQEGPDARVPIFVDDAGRRCAVAELLHVWGEDELVADVARAANHAWIAELAADARFHTWLQRAGLSFQEAARIQGPVLAPPAEPAFVAPSGTPLGPATGMPAPASPSAPSAGAGRAPFTGGAASPATGGVSTAAPTTGSGEALTEAELADWGIWWEYSKLHWLAPERAWTKVPVADGVTTAETSLQVARREAGERLAAELAHPHAAVRRAAAIAYARVVGPAAYAELEELLEDSSGEVRRAALLALGASGSRQAAFTLMRVARDGRLSDTGSRLDPRADVYAVLALGLAPEAGADLPAESLLMAPPASRSGEDLSDHELARLYALSLAGADGLAGEARASSELFDGKRRSRQGRRPVRVRARAVEALAVDTAPDALPKLADALGSREPDVRRSAAAALGGLGDDGALAVLMTGIELESDGHARGLAAIALGQRGGPEARHFLLRELARGRKLDRPWVGLALGILAAETDDDELRDALRVAAAGEKNADTRGALLLALGIAGEAEALEPLAEELAHASSVRTRMFAAVGLGLLRTSEAAVVLRAALDEERSPLVRSAIAQGLGVIGEERDARLLAELLTESSDPLVQGQFAVALGLHGSPDAAAALLDALDAEGADELGAFGRAAAVQGLGLLLSRTDPYRLNRLTEFANHSALPSWLLEPLGTTL